MTSINSDNNDEIALLIKLLGFIMSLNTVSSALKGIITQLV